MQLWQHCVTAAEGHAIARLLILTPTKACMRLTISDQYTGVNPDGDAGDTSPPTFWLRGHQWECPPILLHTSTLNLASQNSPKYAIMRSQIKQFSERGTHSHPQTPLLVWRGCWREHPSPHFTLLCASSPLTLNSRWRHWINSSSGPILNRFWDTAA